MKSKYKNVFWVGLYVLCCSCGSQSPDDYKNYVDNKESGLIQEVESGGFKVTAQYRPATYDLIRAGESITQNDLEAMVKDSLVSFIVRFETVKGDILKVGTQSEEDISNRKNVFNTSISNDFVLVDGADTISCIAHHWEQNYNMTNYTVVSLIFHNSFSDNDKVLVYHDQTFGLGTLTFSISAQSIKNIPSIKL